jgi:hypothetical protein
MAVKRVEEVFAQVRLVMKVVVARVDSVCVGSKGVGAGGQHLPGRVAQHGLRFPAAAELDDVGAVDCAYRAGEGQYYSCALDVGGQMAKFGGDNAGLDLVAHASPVEECLDRGFRARRSSTGARPLHGQRCG